MILPLRLESVSYAVNGRPIIHPLSLELQAGPTTIVLGANGAGKSVLMRLMHGLLAPGSGCVAWADGDARRIRRLQAMVFQRPVLLRRSAQANVSYALKVAGVREPERGTLVRESLESVGLAYLAHRSARVLSGGEQQRQIGRAHV